MVKLSYEQMRMLSEIGDAGGRVVVKNRAGKVLQPALKKWGRNASPKETPSMCMAGQQKPSHAHMGNHLQTCPQVSSSQRPQQVGRR